MSHHLRRLALLLFPSALAILIASCSAAGGASPAPASPGSSAAPSVAPAASSDADFIDHFRGASDIVLRYEEGGGFMMPAFTAAAVPHFTLYGDGTVIFRNPMAEAPPAEGSIFRMNPLRTVRLSEDQIQELLLLALGEGGLAVARENYTNDMIADASTAVFTIEAAGIKKTVSVYALGLEMEGVADGPARAQFKKLADRLTDFDQGGTIATDVYEPEAYRGVLFEAPGIEATDVRDWRWPDINPGDFTPDPDPNANQFPHRRMTIEEVDVLGIKDYQGGFQNLVLKTSDGKTWTFSLRPLLPGEPD